MPGHERASEERNQKVRERVRTKGQELQSGRDVSGPIGEHDMLASSPDYAHREHLEGLTGSGRASQALVNCALLHLQRSHGNAYVQRLLTSRKVQGKQTADKPHNVERSTIAAVAVSPEIKIQRQGGQEEEEIQEKPKAGMQRTFMAVSYQAAAPSVQRMDVVPVQPPGIPAPSAPGNPLAAAMWEAAVVAPLREGHEALVGKKPKVRAAMSKIEQTDPIIVSMRNTYPENSLQNARLGEVKKYMSMLWMGLQPYTGQKYPLAQLREAYDPDNGEKLGKGLNFAAKAMNIEMPVTQAPSQEASE